MPLDPLILLVPSMAAAVELPRRIASCGRALAGLYPFRLLDLARAIAEPALLSASLRAWDSGHDALIAARLLEGPHRLRLPNDLPRAPVAAALARTLSALRLAGTHADALDALSRRAGATLEDGERLAALAELYRRFHQEVEGRFADPATILRAARDRLAQTAWLAGAQALVADDLELDPLEREFLAALAKALPVRCIERQRPRGLVASSFSAWADAHSLSAVAVSATLLAPLEAEAVPAGLRRLRTALFEPPSGDPVRDGSVELLTAPGEAAEVASIVRRLLREAARGVPFEEMGVILPRPDTYAPLFSDTLERLGIPHRLHPSLPLRYGRTARSLLLLLRCRGLPRAAVLELLTFARVPFDEMLGGDARVWPAQWDVISRDAGIVSGLERWMLGLRSHAEQEREGAASEADSLRAERRLRRAADAEALLRVVELLSATLDGLAGEASWPEWSLRLKQVLEQWVGPDRDREVVDAVLADLASLGSIAGGARWDQVEGVLEARFEWERLPLHPVEGGAVHVGVPEAMAGLRFRVVAIPGLVEGGYPGVLRPDPFLLDPEREALRPGRARLAPAPARKQLSLFDDRPRSAAPLPAGAGRGLPAAGGTASFGVFLPTTQDRLLEARRLFHRAISQAGERLILSYPRADPRAGRERMPSLFFAAAASSREGRPLAGGELEQLVNEDDLDRLELEAALDPGERDRIRVRTGGSEAAQAIAGGSLLFKQSRLASRARWSDRITAYDGLVAPLAPELMAQLDPTSAAYPVSASRLATFATCGFQYLLKHVLRLEPALEPEERKRLEPIERGSLFHEVAERFLRELRDRGELPVRDVPQTRTRLLELADAALHGLVKGSPPRFTFLWQRERRRFRETMLGWLSREARNAGDTTPAWFEVGFGLRQQAPPGEPDSPDPLVLDLGDGRTLRVSGKIDRIDRRAGGGLVLRDYKTGRAPKDEGGIFRGGRQLQIPFYILAAETLFPDQPVVEAFLDYVDGGRRVSLEPAVVRSAAFKRQLREVVDVVARGAFVQEPSACDFCDYTSVCGPRPLLELRRGYKIADANLQRVLRLKEIG